MAKKNQAQKAKLPVVKKETPKKEAPKQTNLQDQKLALALGKGKQFWKSKFSIHEFGTVSELATKEAITAFHKKLPQNLDVNNYLVDVNPMDVIRKKQDERMKKYK